MSLPIHVVFVIANESSVPYFNWFADESLKHQGVRFSFVALNRVRPQMLDEMAARRIPAYWLRFDPRRRKAGMLRCLISLYLLFRKIRPDVVHTHLFDDSVPGLLAARLARVRTRVVTKQDTGFHWYYAPRWVCFDRFNNWNATHIHTVATESRKFVVEKEKAEQGKVRLVRNGFPYLQITASNADTVAFLRERYSLAGRMVVGTVARYIHWKGHHLIIQAAKQLVARNPDLLFVWAGSDGGSGYREELQKRIHEAGLSANITLLGWIERSQMPSLYKCMDIYLHPALREPFGFAISEALMNSVPIIATRTGSTDLVEHLVNGYVLTDNDPGDIVAAVSYLLENPGRRRTMGAAGHTHALQHLTFERMWDGHMSMYRKSG